MGILDFLSELAGANGKKASPDDTSNLNLGGIRSLLGVRDAAPTGARGDAMIQATTGDKLPGYFDSASREYVPWYVDLFDGGGINSSRSSAPQGLLSNSQPAQVAMASPAGPVPMASPAGPRASFSDMGYYEPGEARLVPIGEVATADQIAYANAVPKAEAMINRVEGRNDSESRLAAIKRDQDVYKHPRFLEYARIVGENAITESNTNSAVAIANNFRNWLDSQPLNPY